MRNSECGIEGEEAAGRVTGFMAHACNAWALVGSLLHPCLAHDRRKSIRHIRASHTGRPRPPSRDTITETHIMKGTILAAGMAVATLGYSGTATAGGPHHGHGHSGGHGGHHGHYHGGHHGHYHGGYSPAYRSGFYTPYRAVPSYGYGYPSYGYGGGYGSPGYGYGYPSSNFSFGLQGPNGGGFGFSLVR